MARTVADKEYNTFVKGLVTEAGPLTFPENAAKDLDNFDLNRDGSLQRRLGMDYEGSYNLENIVFPTCSTYINTVNVELVIVSWSAWSNTTTFADAKIDTFLWESAGDNQDSNFLVVRIGPTIYIFDAENDPLGNGTPLETTTLPWIFANATGKNYASGRTDANTIINDCIDCDVEFARVNGNLIITPHRSNVAAHSNVVDSSGNTKVRVEGPRIIKWDGSLFTHDYVDLETRDFWGIESDRDDDERLSTLSAEHRYNLYNAGWPLSVADGGQSVLAWQDSDGTGKYSVSDAIQEVDTREGWYPALSDSFIAAKIAGDESPVGVPALNSQYLLGDKYFTEAAKGRFVINPFYRGGTRGDLVPSLPTTYYLDSSRQAYVSSVAGYAGRCFYSTAGSSTVSYGDTKSPSLSSYLFFTQIITSFDDQIGKCYQKNDPTSEISDLLADDGGFIPIPNAKNIIKLVPFGQFLVIFAENGVWALRGGDAGFTAVDYAIDQVSSVGCISADSIVLAETGIFYWANAGIYGVVPGEGGLNLRAQNLTEDSIQTRYISYVENAKKSARAIYDERAREIEWWFNPNADGTTDVNKYTQVLIFDLVLQAWSTYTVGELATDSPWISSPTQLTGFSAATEVVEITYGGGVDGVTYGTGTGDVVAGTTINRANATSSVKYLTIKPTTGGTFKFTFSLLKDTTFYDWKSDDATGVDAAGYIDTGWETGGETQRYMQSPYLTMHFKPTETGFTGTDDLEADFPSSCLVRTKWEFANTGDVGRWSSQYQAYRLKRLYVPTTAQSSWSYGFDVVTTKQKVRGKGRAMSLRFDTEAGKDCHIYGWALRYSVGRDV